MIGFLLLLQSVPVPPARVALYQETVTLLPGGGRAVSLEIRLCGAGTVRLPLAWRLPDTAQVTISPDVHAALVRGPGSPRVELRSETPGTTVNLAFHGAGGPGLHYRLVNGTEADIDTFRLRISLASGTVPSSVRYSVPAADSAPGRHVMRLHRDAAAREVWLDAGPLAAGDIVELSLAIDPERKSFLPLVAGGLASIAFLIRRRASVRPPA